MHGHWIKKLSLFYSGLMTMQALRLVISTAGFCAVRFHIDVSLFGIYLSRMLNGIMISSQVGQWTIAASKAVTGAEWFHDVGIMEWGTDESSAKKKAITKVVSKTSLLIIANWAEFICFCSAFFCLVDTEVGHLTGFYWSIFGANFFCKWIEALGMDIGGYDTNFYFAGFTLSGLWTPILKSLLLVLIKDETGENLAERMTGQVVGARSVKTTLDYRGAKWLFIATITLSFVTCVHWCVILYAVAVMKVMTDKVEFVVKWGTGGRLKVAKVCWNGGVMGKNETKQGKLSRSWSAETVQNKEFTFQGLTTNWWENTMLQKKYWSDVKEVIVEWNATNEPGQVTNVDIQLRKETSVRYSVSGGRQLNPNSKTTATVLQRLQGQRHPGDNKSGYNLDAIETFTFVDGFDIEWGRCLSSVVTKVETKGSLNDKIENWAPGIGLTVGMVSGSTIGAVIARIMSDINPSSSLAAGTLVGAALGIMAGEVGLWVNNWSEETGDRTAVVCCILINVLGLGTVYSIYPGMAPCSITQFQYFNRIEIMISLLSAIPAFCLVGLSFRAMDPGGANASGAGWKAVYCTLGLVLLMLTNSCEIIVISVLHFPGSKLAQKMTTSGWLAVLLTVTMVTSQLTSTHIGLLGCTGWSGYNAGVISLNNTVTVTAMAFTSLFGEGYLTELKKYEPGKWPTQGMGRHKAFNWWCGKACRNAWQIWCCIGTTDLRRDIMLCRQ